jgi:hypothetical protein
VGPRMQEPGNLAGERYPLAPRIDACVAETPLHQNAWALVIFKYAAYHPPTGVDTIGSQGLPLATGCEPA